MTNREKFVIRKANLNDLEVIKKLADTHKRELGFILRPALARSIELEELMIATVKLEVVGFIQYHHRQDTQTTLHNLLIKADYRGNGIGKRLMQALENEVMSQNKQILSLKCPEELPANDFYARLGYQQVNIESGKQRRLNIWQKTIKRPDFNNALC